MGGAEILSDGLTLALSTWECVGPMSWQRGLHTPPQHTLLLFFSSLFLLPSPGACHTCSFHIFSLQLLEKVTQVWIPEGRVQRPVFPKNVRDLWFLLSHKLCYPGNSVFPLPHLCPCRTLAQWLWTPVCVSLLPQTWRWQTEPRTLGKIRPGPNYIPQIFFSFKPLYL